MWEWPGDEARVFMQTVKEPFLTYCKVMCAHTGYYEYEWGSLVIYTTSAKREWCEHYYTYSN